MRPTPWSSTSPTIPRGARRARVACAVLGALLTACSGGGGAAGEGGDRGTANQEWAAGDAAASTAPAAMRDDGAAGKVGGGAVAAMVAPPSPPAAGTAPDAQPTAPAPGPEPAGAVAEPMLIRTGHAAVEVDSIELAEARLVAHARSLGGYVSGSTLQGGREQPRSATLTIKVPAPRFDQLVGGLAPLGRVQSLTQESQDVTEEFVDIGARTANARRLETRLVELLARRTGKLDEVLAVERELARVREEIERYEGRLRYLRTRAAVSTLTVTLTEPRAVLRGEPGPNPIAEALRRARDNFVGFVVALIGSLGWLLPLGAIAWVLWRLVRRHRQTQRRPPTDPQPPDAQGPRTS